jgi:hypothetical protein
MTRAMHYSTYRLRKCGEKWQTSEGTEFILALSIRISSKAPVPFKDGKYRSSLTSERILEMEHTIDFSLLLQVSYDYHVLRTVFSTEVKMRMLPRRRWRLDCRVIPEPSTATLAEILRLLHGQRCCCSNIYSCVYTLCKYFRDVYKYNKLELITARQAAAVAENTRAQSGWYGCV